MPSRVRLGRGLDVLCRTKCFISAASPSDGRPRVLFRAIVALALCVLLFAGRAHAQAFPTPTGVAAATVSATQIRVTWTGNSAASGYVVYRSDVSGPLGNVTGTALIDGSLQPGHSYTYSVASADCGGDPASSQSGTVTAQTYTLPVVSVSASPNSPSNSILVTWTATDSGGPGIANYSVYRNGILVTPTPITATTFTDTGLNPGFYTYIVKAADTAGDIGTGTASATTYPSPTLSVTATAVSASSIALSWSASDSGGPGIANYNVYRNGTLLTGTPITTTSYTDTGLAAGTGYTYTVRVYDSVGDSGSANASATTYSVPAVSVSASAASASSVSISWSATDSGGPGIRNYNLYRNGALLVGSTTATSYTDSGLSAGSSYTYSVTAFDMAGDSQSASTTGSTFPIPGVSVSASPVSASSIALSWTASDSGGPGIARYNVYRNGALLTPSPITTTSYTDTGLSAGTNYTYTVNAYDTVGDVGSGSVTRATYPVPSVSVSASDVAYSTSVTISWSASDSGGPGISSYNLYRNGALLTSTTSTSYTDSGLAGSTTYTYTVNAYDPAGDAGSGGTSVTTLPAAPVETLSPNPPIRPKQTYTISWAAVAGALNHYTFVRQTDIPSTVTLTLPPSTRSESYTASGAGTLNTFTVRACISADDSQCSAWSNAINVAAVGPGS